MAHVINYKIDAIADELQYLRMNLGVKTFIFEIILPMLRLTGVMVGKNKFTVTQEHIISTLVREQLGKVAIPNAGFVTTEIALATPEGNLHELPILIGDILCRSNRLNTRYLGASHPAECLGKAVSALKCSHLVLGVISSDQVDYSKKIIPYLQKLDRSLEREISIILGGATKVNFPIFKNIIQINAISTLDDFDQLLMGGL